MRLRKAFSLSTVGKVHENLARRTKEEIIDKISLMKDEVIESLRTHTPLSQRHAELEKRLDMDYVDLLE